MGLIRGLSVAMLKRWQALMFRERARARFKPAHRSKSTLKKPHHTIWAPLLISQTPLGLDPSFEAAHPVVGPMGRSVADLEWAARICSASVVVADKIISLRQSRDVLETVEALCKAGHECIEIKVSDSAQAMRLFTGITSDSGKNDNMADKRIHMFSRSWTGPGPRRPLSFPLDFAPIFIVLIAVLLTPYWYKCTGPPVYAFVASTIVVVDRTRFVACRRVDVYSTYVGVRRVADFAPGWLTPSQNSISERSPSSPPEKSQCEVLQREYGENFKIAGIVTIIGGSIAKTIAGTQVKYRDYQDS
ncbi:hypothetical protein BGY98DRAFT_935201 [Russula aff. rugulosa BPL654]|nr:hypothetical protein BGY98DRAFT_935201 [Russula aff. rugulosa BPL654]